MMKYPRAAMVHKFLFMMLVNSFYMFNKCDERYFNLYKDKIRGV